MTKAKQKSRRKKGRKQEGYKYTLAKKGGKYILIGDAGNEQTPTDVNNELTNCFDAFEDIVTTVVTKQRRLGTGSGVHIHITDL
jgi:hypothetical protein